MKFSIKPVLSVLPLVTLASCLTFSVDPKADPIFVVDEKFISATLDSSNIASRFANFNLSDPRLLKLMSHLAPMYFRIGGTTADSVVFSADGSSTASAVLTGSDWLRLYEFSKNAGVRILYDLNSLLRNGDGSWNSENAEEMISFSQENQLDLDWELGNEPDLYSALFGTYVDASQLGNDYKTLRAILNKYDQYKSSLLIGADMFDVGANSGTQNYLTDLLKTGSEAINAVTWHQYYFPGDVATEDLFINPNTFNYLEQRTQVVKNIADKVGQKIWLGETSSAYKGGAPGKSDRFLAAFLWLDKLGLGARLGIELIIRQTFYGYNYALVSNSSTPNPDWWLSVIYKRLVGPKVLSLTSDASETSKIRLYAHCAKVSPSENSSNSAVVVFGLNLDNADGSFDLGELESDNEVYAYEFTSESTLYSQLIRLNGEVLYLTSDLELPSILPKTIEKSTTYTLPPYSIGFWIFTNTNVDACQS